VVEDAAEALGARYKGRAVGCDGLMSCLSFNGNKIITTGGGGMVLTRDATMAARLRRLTTQARTDAIEYIHEETGYNYRLTNLQAALGVAQLEQLDGFVEAKRATVAHYGELLSGAPGVTMFAEAAWARSAYWMASVLLHERRCPDVRDLLRRLTEDGIGARPLWRPLNIQPVFATLQTYRVEVAPRLYDRGLSLPCSVAITPSERETVAATLLDRLRS
jgi:dTDP-4-amino-4,6-dideoxygalactose transaminase